MGKALKILTVFVGFAAALIGVFFQTEIPKKCGLYTYLGKRYIKHSGVTPAFLYNIPWNYTLEELREENNLQGQRALITGASAGIGFAMTAELAKLGAEVIMGCRNAEKCVRRANEIKKEYPNAKLVTMTMDTNSFKSVKAFAEEYKEKFVTTKSETANEYSSNNIDNLAVGALDMLFLNAGTVHFTNKTHPCVPLSEDNIEYVFQTNYVGHHLLYRLLEPYLQLSNYKPATVVHTSSAASFDTYSYKVATDLETLNGCNESAFSSYGQSKLAQILWVKELTKRLLSDQQEQPDIIANAFHPGLVASEIFDKGEGPALFKRLVNYLIENGVAWNITEGALTGLYLGVAKNRLVKQKTMGKYFHPQVMEVDNVIANDEDLQRRLWEFSDSLVEAFL